MATFGYTEIGSQTASGFGDDQSVVTRFTLSENALVSKLTSYGAKNTSGSTTTQGIIYAVTDGLPSSLLGASEVVSHGNTPQWRDYVFTSPIELVAGEYYIGVVFSSIYDLYYETSAGQSYRGSNAPYPGALYDPFGAGFSMDRKFSFYATYTPIVTGRTAASGRSASSGRTASSGRVEAEGRSSI